MSRKRQFFRLLYVFLIAIFIFLNSCSNPRSKENYLEEYALFINQLKFEYKDYSLEDWENVDQRYKRFNNEWHDLFKDEFTASDELEILGFQYQYNLMKTSDKLSDYFNSNLKEGIEDIRKKVFYYVENNLEEDLLEFRKKADEISDSLGNVVSELIDEAIRDK